MQRGIQGRTVVVDTWVVGKEKRWGKREGGGEVVVVFGQCGEVEVGRWGVKVEGDEWQNGRKGQHVR